MTRMWLLNPSNLCDEHLLGEHKEMHQIAGSIENHPYGKAIAQGHADKNQIDTSLIQDRHDELVEELEAREMNHGSPLDYEDELHIGEIDIRENLKDLMARCEKCRENFTGEMTQR